MQSDKTNNNLYNLVHIIKNHCINIPLEKDLTPFYDKLSENPDVFANNNEPEIPLFFSFYHTVVLEDMWVFCPTDKCYEIFSNVIDNVKQKRIDSGELSEKTVIPLQVYYNQSQTPITYDMYKNEMKDKFKIDVY